MKQLGLLFLLLMLSITFCHAADIQLSGRGRCGFKTTTPSPPASSHAQGEAYSKWEKELKRKPHKQIKLIESHIIGKFLTNENFKEDPRAINGILKFIGSKPNFGIQQFEVAYKDPDLPRIQKDRLTVENLDDTVARINATAEDVQTLTQVFHPDPSKEGQIDEQAMIIDIVIDRGQNNIYDYLAVFMNGHAELKLTTKQRNVLKDYLLAGGFLYASACCGYSEFEKGFRKEMKLMFPDKELKLLDKNHPLYSSYYQIDSFEYSGKQKIPDGTPCLEGIDIGCKTAVLFSPYDFCCAWDGHIHGDQDPYASERELAMETSMQLGANMISYSLGYRDLSKPLKPGTVLQKQNNESRSGFIFAQIKHQGDWDPDPKGVNNLLQFVAKNTNVKVYPKRRVVDLEKTDIFRYPFLYMTGHNGFSFKKEVLEKLNVYLKKGGFLFADSCCGEKQFDYSIRRLVKQLFPNNPLQKIPHSHPIFTVFYDIRKVNYTMLTTKNMPLLIPPIRNNNEEEEITPIWKENNNKTVTAPLLLEGVFIDNRLVFVYSKYDIGCSWEQSPCLMCKGIDPLSPMGFKIASNIIIYSFSGS